MTEAKEFFQQIRNIDQQIDTKCEHLERLKSLSTKITSTMKEDVVKSSGSGRTMENSVEKIIELQAEINEEIDRYIDLKKEAILIIEKLENEKHRRILEERYLLGKTFEQISVDMDYSYFGICKLHGSALNAADVVIQQRKKLKEIFEKC